MEQCGRETERNDSRKIFRLSVLFDDPRESATRELRGHRLLKSKQDAGKYLFLYCKKKGMQTKSFASLYRGEVSQRVPCQEITRNKPHAN